MNKLIYLASQYTDTSPTRQRFRANLVTQKCAALHDVFGDEYTFFSPIVHGHTIAPWMLAQRSHAWWMAHCAPMFYACQELWIFNFQPNWLSSAGIRQEIAWALDRDMPVRLCSTRLRDDRGQPMRPPIVARCDLEHLLQRYARASAPTSEPGHTGAGKISP